MNDKKLIARFRTAFAVVTIGVAALTAVAVFLMVSAEVSMVATMSTLGGGLVLIFVVIAMGNSLAQSVIKPAKEIAEGNFNYKGDDELGQIAQQMRDASENMEKLREFMIRVEQNAQRGDIATVPLRSELKGVHLEIAEATNRILDAVATDISRISSALGNVGDGQLSMALNAGVRGSLARPLENLSKALQAFCADVTKFAGGIMDGSQQSLIPADRYKGHWHEMARSLNKSRQATSDHLLQASEALSALGIGNLTATLPVEGGGQFTRYANAFNGAVEQLSRQVETICKALGERTTDRRVTGDFPGDFAKIRIAMEAVPEPTVQPRPSPFNNLKPTNITDKKTTTTTTRKPRDTSEYRQMSGAYKAPVSSSTGSRARDYLKSDFGKY
ncbi:MAG: HAMP domain-containing protein [Defluviitaleaceae bacterium]|nr:HAMP domain-containing protein [Defluviitaleaceae bacterium]